MFLDTCRARQGDYDGAKILTDKLSLVFPRETVPKQSLAKRLEVFHNLLGSVVLHALVGADDLLHAHHDRGGIVA
jgi:hypothetical protein